MACLDRSTRANVWPYMAGHYVANSHFCVRRLGDASQKLYQSAPNKTRLIIYNAKIATPKLLRLVCECNDQEDRRFVMRSQLCQFLGSSKRLLQKLQTRRLEYFCLGRHLGQK